MHLFYFILNISVNRFKFSAENAENFAHHYTMRLFYFILNISVNRFKFSAENAENLYLSVK